MKKIVLILILVLAFIFRFWRLGSFPALNADEAAIGYNAYSLIQTGKDEHGNPWPIHFQSFNDYKPGLYVYMVLPFVKLFGLNEWSVRIPGALLGVATIYVVYLLVQELFGKDGSRITDHGSLAIIASFFLAISPWHIHFSRGGWEVNVATFFIIVGFWQFLKGLKNLKYLLLSCLFFVLSLYTYHAARIIAPLLVAGAVVIYWSDVKTHFKNFLIAGILGLILVIPLIRDFTRPEIMSRAAGVGLFADTGPLARINEQRGEHGDYTGLVPKLLHNKAVNYGLAFLTNWSAHYNGEFLFLNGDSIQRDKVPETGEMYLFDIIFLVVGIVEIFRIISGGRGDERRGWLFVLWWLIVAPAAAALTFQSPHALRAQNMVIPLVIISSLGLLAILRYLKNQKKFLFVIGNLSLVIIIAWAAMRYLHMYWVHMAKEYPYSSQYGVKELVSFIELENGKYDKVVVTNRYDQPYILFLFYMKYPPAKFQSEHQLTGRDEYGFSTVNRFDKYIFKSIDWDSDKLVYRNSFIAGTDEEIPKEANIIKDIYGINGYKYFEVVAN